MTTLAGDIGGTHTRLALFGSGSREPMSLTTYASEDHHGLPEMVQSFLAGQMPDENWHDGLAVTEVLMACYKSAEEGRTVSFPTELGDFVPAVARGTWRA